MPARDPLPESGEQGFVELLGRLDRLGSLHLVSSVGPAMTTSFLENRQIGQLPPGVWEEKGAISHLELPR